MSDESAKATHENQALENAERDGEMLALRMLVTVLLTEGLRARSDPEAAAESLLASFHQASADLPGAGTPLEEAKQAAYLRVIESVIESSLKAAVRNL